MSTAQLPLQLALPPLFTNSHAKGTLTLRGNLDWLRMIRCGSKAIVAPVARLSYSSDWKTLRIFMAENDAESRGSLPAVER
ncbi:MAG: hypothetical protein ABI684_12055 [Nitrospirota bacterium]